MNRERRERSNYGNWIRLRAVIAFLAVGLALAGASLLPMSWLLRILLYALAAFPLGMGVYLLYVYVQFASWGGGIQDRLWDLILDHLASDGRGRALDIGTGNGALAVRLAKRYPDLHVVAVDYWGSDWEYAQANCERNARLEGVDERVDFYKASAASLPFKGGAFDHVVSHFVFHEVSALSDKREVIREALRVLRAGGTFAFQDMFLDKTMYGVPGDLVATIRSWGVSEVTFIESGSQVVVPRLLRNRRALGHASVLCGRK
jgi:SAM-dependent methyltransferase